VLQCFFEHFSRCGCEGEPSVEGKSCGTTLGEREVPHHCQLFADFVKEKLPAWARRRSTELERGLVSRVAGHGDTKVVRAIIAAEGIRVTRSKQKCPVKWNAKFKCLNAGTIFGWVPSPSTSSTSEQAVAGGEQAIAGDGVLVDGTVCGADADSSAAGDANPLDQEVTANVLLTLASAQPSLLVLILNLDRRSDRLEALRAQSGMQRLRCERVEAVDGASSSWEDLAPVLTPSALEDARWAELHRVPTLCKATESFSPHHTRASAACAATHKKAWEWLEASSSDVALILEDDARVAPDLADAVQQVLGALEQHPFWKVCYLGTHEGGINLKGAGKRAALADELEQGEVRTGLAGYLLRRSDVRDLLDGVFPLDEQLDVALSQHAFGHGARYELYGRAQLVVSPPSQDGTTDVQTFGDARCHDHLPSRMASRVLMGSKRRWSLRDQLHAAQKELRQLRRAPRAATSGDAATREERRSNESWKGRTFSRPSCGSVGHRHNCM
jgi:glycosyl transferase, family 25